MGCYHRERTRLPWAEVVQACEGDPTLNWDNLQLLGVTPKVQVALSLLPKPYTLNPSLHWDNLQLLGVTPKVQVALFLLLSLLLSVLLSLEWKGVGCPALR